MVTASYEGGCLCGRIRFRVDGPGGFCCNCHCRSCRLASGAPFVAWATFGANRFEVTKGSLSYCRSSESVRRGFCGDCGSSITYQHDRRPEEIDIATVTVDEPAGLEPQAHLWVRDRMPWVSLDDGLEAYDGWRTDSAPPSD